MRRTRTLRSGPLCILVISMGLAHFTAVKTLSFDRLVTLSPSRQNKIVAKGEGSKILSTEEGKERGPGVG